MVLPRTYDEFDFDVVFKFEKLAALARKLGIVRFYYSDSSLPDVPMIMFISDGKEVQGTNWIESHYDYASDLANAKVIELDCGHYVHNFMQDMIAEDIREFIGE